MHPSEESQNLELTYRDNYLPLQQAAGSKTYPHLILDMCMNTDMHDVFICIYNRHTCSYAYTYILKRKV